MVIVMMKPIMLNAVLMVGIVAKVIQVWIVVQAVIVSLRGLALLEFIHL
jgi:hypothetical protein